MTIWIVGRVIQHLNNGSVWEFAGAFSTEEKALAAAKAPGFFVGKTKLDFIVPDESVSWPGAYYPHGNLNRE